MPSAFDDRTGNIQAYGTDTFPGTYEIYIASKTRYAEQWRKLRDRGANVISTWIDEAGPGQTKDPAELVQRCLSEIRTCDALLLYVERDDQPKGAYFEAGAALMLEKTWLSRVLFPFMWKHFLNCRDNPGIVQDVGFLRQLVWYHFNPERSVRVE